MPVHDWTRVDAGLFHAFHQRWIGALCDALNTGGLPSDYFALAEQSIRGPIPDVLALRLSPGKGEPSGTAPALDVATPRPAPGGPEHRDRRLCARRIGSRSDTGTARSWP